MAPGVFWGILLVIIGLGLIFRILFDVNLFRVIIAVILILAGIRILVGDRGPFRYKTEDNDVMFGERKISSTPNNNTEYNVIFGKSVFDFRDIDFKDNKPIRLKMNTIFGGTVVKISKATPVKIKTNAAFAGARMPDGNSTVFGTYYYSTDSFDSSGIYLYIDTNVVFGSLEVKAY